MSSLFYTNVSDPYFSYGATLRSTYVSCSFDYTEGISLLVIHRLNIPEALKRSYRKRFNYVYKLEHRYINP